MFVQLRTSSVTVGEFVWGFGCFLRTWILHSRENVIDTLPLPGRVSVYISSFYRPSQVSTSKVQLDQPPVYILGRLLTSCEDRIYTWWIDGPLQFNTHLWSSGVKLSIKSLHSLNNFMFVISCHCSFLFDVSVSFIFSDFFSV